MDPRVSLAKDSSIHEFKLGLLILDIVASLFPVNVRAIEINSQRVNYTRGGHNLVHKYSGFAARKLFLFGMFIF